MSRCRRLAALRQTEPRKLMALLRGELDWVVMKCLEKHRDRRYETANALAKDVQRYLDDEAVEARPPSAGYRLGKFLSGTRARCWRRASCCWRWLGGLAAVVAVQQGGQRRGSGVADARAKANAALATANGELKDSPAAVQARYDLAVEAIKTFHTGVSEDFLLKEEQFKELRDRLLKSASDFYGKLGALLGKETDVASRRALAQSNFELADLTGKVGRNADALAAHRAVLAAREALAAEPAAGAEAKVDVGRSLIAVAGLLEATGKTDEALATYRRSESLLAGPAGADRRRGPRWRPAGRKWVGSCRPTGKSADALAAYRLARADQEALAAAPEASNEPATTWRTPSTASAACCRRRASRSEAEAEYRRRWRSTRSWPTTTPPSPSSASTWRTATTTSASCCGIRASRRRRRPSSARRWRSCRSWPTTTPPSPNSAATWRSHHNLGCVLSRTGKPAEAEAEYRRRWRSTRSWPTTTPPSPIPHSPGDQPLLPRLPAVEYGQASGGGGRVPQGAGDPAEAGRRQPRRHRFRFDLARATTTSASC